MTDDNVRPEVDPTRESRPGGPDEGVADDLTSDVKDTADDVEATVEANAVERASDESIADAEPSDFAEPAVEVADESPEATVAATAAPAADAEVEADVAGETEADSGGGAIETVEPATSETGDVETTSVEAADTDESSSPGAKTAESETDTKATPAVTTADLDQRTDAFTWHPEYKGKSFDEVRAELEQDIAADQRQHRLAMDGAEDSEQEALASVVGLERKWGKYDFDWADQEPESLADRILGFERERERRHQLISWSEYRDADGEVDEAQAAGERPAELSTSAKGLSLLLVVLLIVVILLAVWAL